MRQTTKIGSILFALLISASVHAEGFTFTAQDEPMAIVDGVDVAGQRVRGQMVQGTSVMTLADGKKIDGTHKCSSLFNHPHGASSPINMICEVVNSTGTYTLIAGCRVTAGKAFACLGDIVGKSGSYSGRLGLITIYTKDKTVTGVGQFFDEPST